MTRAVTLLTLAFGILSASATASAQTSERPFYAGGGIGATIRLERLPSQLMLAEEVGYHLFGTTDGLFVGGALAQGLDDTIQTFHFGARVGYDLALLRTPDATLLLAPSVAPGFAIARVSANTPWGRASDTDSAFLLQGAVDLKLLLLDESLELFVRPAAVDLFIDDNVSARYNLLVGAGGRL